MKLKNINKNNNNNIYYKIENKKNLNLTNKLNNKNNLIYQEIYDNLKKIHILKDNYINKSKQIYEIKLLKIKKIKENKIKKNFENYKYLIDSFENEKNFFLNFKTKIENEHILKIRHDNDINKEIKNFKETKINLLNKIIKYKNVLNNLTDDKNFQEIKKLIEFTDNYNEKENYISSEDNQKNVNKIKIFTTQINHMN